MVKWLSIGGLVLCAGGGILFCSLRAIGMIAVPVWDAVTVLALCILVFTFLCLLNSSRRLPAFSDDDDDDPPILPMEPSA